MKTVMKALLIFLVFYSSLFAENKKLKIAIPSDMTPYAFIEQGNIPSGIFVDFWKLWAKKNKQEIEFVASTWQGTLEAIKNKEVDIHSGLFKNSQRAEFLEFLEPIYKSESHIYVSNELTDEIKSIDDIANRTIGIQKGTYFETYLPQNYPKTKIRRYDNFEKLFTAIKNREVDLLIEDSSIIQSYLIKNFGFNKASILPGYRLHKWFYAAIKKGDEKLKKLVNQGFKNISPNELRELERKWVIKDKFNYFSKKDRTDTLTFEQRNWLLNHPINLAVVKDLIRFSYIDRDGELKGFHIDLIKQMNKNLNLEIKHKLFENWPKAFFDAKEGKVEGVLGLSWSKEREEFFNYSPPYHFSPFHIVARVEEEGSSLSDFNKKIAVTQKNSITNKILNNEFDKIKIIHATSIEGILKAIQEKKADFALMESAKELGLENYGLKSVGLVYKKYGELYIGSAKNKKMAHAILEKAINSITKKQMKALKDKWFNKKIVFTKEELNYIKNAPPLKVGIEQWSGIIGSKDGQSLEGVAGELIEKAFEISGLKVKYIKGDWSEILKGFKNKTIDILPASIYTKQREEYGYFSEKYFSMKHYIYVKSDNTNINSLADLQNKRLALQKDTGPLFLIKELYPKIKIVEAKNLEELIQKVLNGEADALFEAQLAVQNEMKKQLITNLKSVSQNSLKDQGLHFFLKKDALLRTILNKSLALISHEEKNEIISKWLYVKDEIKDVNVAFGLGRDPYILDKNFMKGIEYDLVNKTLNRSSINIKNKKNISVEEIKNIFNTDKNIDMAVSVKEDKNSELFYSDTFVEFTNVVVSRKDEKLKIDSLQDLAKLKDKRIIAFLNAYKELGEEYYSLYNLQNRPSTYTELSFQEDQVGSFLKKETDLIILDKNIFKWFFNELDGKDISNYKLHYIFPKNNAFKVAFKNERLRNIFNKNLKQVRKSGDYQEIINNYTQGYIKAKVKINSLISLIVGKYIFDNNQEELKKVVNIFTQLPYIEKIEVFNLQNELLANSIKKESTKFILTETYNFINNLPEKVGFIKVYFNNKLLKEYEKSSVFIPTIKKFEKLNSFDFIKEVYKKFQYLTNGIEFTKEELDFIRRKKVITLSTTMWEPITVIENGQYNGLLSEYIKIIANKTGLEFKFIEPKSWVDATTNFKNKKIDMMPMGEAAFTFKDAFVSNSMVSFKYAIISNNEGTYLDGLKDLKNKTVAVPKGYSSFALIKNNYPEIRIVETKSVDEALKMVSKNEVDAFVGHSAIAIHSIQNSFPDLKIVGLSEEKFHHYILMQDSYPEFLSIANKVIANISQEQRQKIKDKWIRTEVKTAIDYSILYRIVAVFSLILIIVLVFTKKLSSAKKEIENRNRKIEETLMELEDSNTELEATIENLKQTQEQLIESEKMASLAGLVAGVAHEINTPVGIGLTGSSHLAEITSNIKNSYNEKQMSQEAFEKYLNTSEELANLVTNNLKKAANLVKSFKQVAVDQASEEKRTFELKAYIGEILASLNNILKKTNLKIDIICKEDIIINSYPGAISQVLTNLIMNSIIHGYKEKEEGIITIKITQTNSVVDILYKDDGKGIPKENISKVFEPFFTTNREKGGSGLGLNIIYNIVTSSLHGKIRCLDKEEKGAQFEISFRV